MRYSNKKKANIKRNEPKEGSTSNIVFAVKPRNKEIAVITKAVKVTLKCACFLFEDSLIEFNLLSLSR